MRLLRGTWCGGFENAAGPEGVLMHERRNSAFPIGDDDAGLMRSARLMLEV